MGWEDSLEEESNSLQYSCLENLIDSGAWQATDDGVAELDMTEDSRTLCFKCVYVCVFCHSVVSEFVAHQASLSMEFFQARILQQIAISYSRGPS